MKVKITKENLIRKYNAADVATKKTLEAIFGQEIFQPRSIIGRVKSYKDACEVLGISPILDSTDLCICEKNDEMHEHYSFRQSLDKHTLAYLKLRVITSALNDGWLPPQDTITNVWYPLFFLYTPDELAALSKQEKTAYHMLSIVKNSSILGFGCLTAYKAPNMAANVGSHLCLRTPELAEYCGRQFIELWADMLLI